MRLRYEFPKTPLSLPHELGCNVDIVCIENSAKKKRSYKNANGDKTLFLDQKTDKNTSEKIRWKNKIEKRNESFLLWRMKRILFLAAIERYQQ